MTDNNNDLAKQSADSKPNLNPNAATFVPSFLKSKVLAAIDEHTSQSASSTQSTEIATSVSLSSSSTAQNTNNSATFNVNAPVFIFKKSSHNSGGQSAQGLLSQGLLGDQSILGGVPLVGGSNAMDALNGYINPFASKSAAGSSAALQKKKQANQNDESKKKIYSIEFMMSIRNQNKDRPANMALLDFPHKKRRNLKKGDMTDSDKFNFTVRELRIMLNKLSIDNFDTVSKKILNDYAITPSLLNELMKIIFMKATTEVAYLEVYVRLCIQLFKKYNDKENKEMNFKKLLLMKCQKQFYKMYEKEEQQRKSRKASMQLDEQNSSNAIESDFNKQMLFVFDESDLRHRQKLQLFGNMQLIVELYLHNQIPEGIIMTCIASLMEDLQNDQSVEILCQMLTKIATHVTKKARQEKENEKHMNQINASAEKRAAAKRKSIKNCAINLEYVEGTLQRLFSYRNSDSMSSRIKFKIQDLMDIYNEPNSWREVIYEERLMIDSEGFQYKYVPKDMILSEEAVKKNMGSGKRRKGTENSQNDGYMYVKKNQEKTPSHSKTDGSGSKTEGGLKYQNKNHGSNSSLKKNTLTSLLRDLKPDGSSEKGNKVVYSESESEEDENVTKMIGRKVSMNETNVIGMNFEKYNNQKPTQEVRRKIANYFAEYKENNDYEYGKTSFLDISKETQIQGFVFVGYILNNAFSQDLPGWNQIFKLIFEDLLLKEKFFTKEQLLEGIHVSMANFHDTLIDYPNSKDYAFQMFERLGELEVLNPEMIEKYRKHVENLVAEVEDY